MRNTKSEPCNVNNPRAGRPVSEYVRGRRPGNSTTRDADPAIRGSDGVAAAASATPQRGSRARRNASPASVAPLRAVHSRISRAAARRVGAVLAALMMAVNADVPARVPAPIRAAHRSAAARSSVRTEASAVVTAESTASSARGSLARAIAMIRSASASALA